MEEDSLHIVVFPWLAFGHMLPFLELSKSLARRCHHVSFISTPRNIERLPKVPPEISHLINFISFTLPKVEGLPDNVEATTDFPQEEVQYLKKALDLLETPFSEFIKEASPKPDWIIHDFAQYWIPPIAADIGVRTVFFNGIPAAALSFFGPLSQYTDASLRRLPEDFTVPPPWVTFPTKVAYRLYEARKLFEHGKRHNESGVPEAHRFVMVLKDCTAVALRCCRELEPEWVSLLQEIYDKPVIPVGLLPPPVIEVDENNEKEVEIMKWLDKQSSRSVVYVALGTEVTISSELVHELAYGLELAEVPFLWALRRPVSSSAKMEILPKDFEARTKDHGFVAMGWVPQVNVLAHGSVGGFLTHCGWSSLVENLQFGHPLVLLPIFGDQGLNARLMEEKGIGIEVERNEEDGSFTRKEMAKVLRLIMVEDEGESYRKKAKQMKETFAINSSHEKYVDDFVDFLKSH